MLTHVGTYIFLRIRDSKISPCQTFSPFLSDRVRHLTAREGEEKKVGDLPKQRISWNEETDNVKVKGFSVRMILLLLYVGQVMNYFLVY